MQPSILARIARVYLLLVGIVAVFLGVFLLFPPSLVTLLPLPSIAGILRYIAPLPIFFWTPYILFTDTAVPPIIPYPIDAILVIGWGVLGILALVRAQRNIRWLYVWYGLSAAAVFGTAYDIAITTTGVDQYPYLLSGVVVSAVLVLATFVLHAGLRRVRSGSSAGTNGSNAGPRFM